MRLGVIARGDQGGLAAQSQEVARHLGAKTLMFDLGTAGRGKFCPQDCPDMRVVQWGPDSPLSTEGVDWFLDGVDVIWSAETFYEPPLVRTARRRGVRPVLHANPELSHDEGAHVVCATPWEIKRFGHARVLPHPVAQDRFPARSVTKVQTFYHPGAPAMIDRNGTDLLLEAVKHIRSDMRIIVRGSPRTRWPNNPRVQIDLVAAHEGGYWQHYPPIADALVLPRRYGGLSLPMQEAAALGWPIVTLDLEPQRSWVHPSTLVPSSGSKRVQMRGGAFGVHRCAPEALAATMDALVSDPDLAADASSQSRLHATQISWDAQHDNWVRVLLGQ